MIYRVTKCEIDLPTLRIESTSAVDKREKCEKVSQSAIKCDRFGIVLQNQAPDGVGTVQTRLVDCGAERLCVNEYPTFSPFSSQRCRILHTLTHIAAGSFSSYCLHYRVRSRYNSS